MAICVVFKMTIAAILFCEKLEILTACPLSGTNLRHHAKVHQTVAEIWRYNGFHIGGRPPFWILEIQIF